MHMRADLTELEMRIGYAFRDRQYLVRALTHRSRFRQPVDDDTPTTTDNEQLEFLGDSILGFLVSEWLLQRFPESMEGGLSKRKAHLVSADHLLTVALRLSLGDYLLLGRGEEVSGGRKKRALLTDAVEALIASIYLDGGMEEARQFVVNLILQDQIDDEVVQNSGDRDYKTALQERAQLLKLPAPKYVIVRQAGPEHARLFTMEVRVGDNWVCQAEGSSKKSAGQRAAELLLQKLPQPKVKQT